MVYDICHQAVEYEDIGASLQKLADNGIPVFKLQEAAAMRVPNVTKETVAAMRPFADTVYLTQTIEKIDGKLNRYLNLEDAFAAFEANRRRKREWRTHVHVPVFLDKIGEHFETTRFAIEDALKFHKKNKLSPQLEIETYTWDVLPDSMKTRLDRRLRGARARLGAGPARRCPHEKPKAEKRIVMKVGFIGLGRMGQAMAARLSAAVTSSSSTTARATKCAELEKEGAKVAARSRKRARGREVVISMVSDDKALPRS